MLCWMFLPVCLRSSEVQWGPAVQHFRLKGNEAGFTVCKWDPQLCCKPLTVCFDTSVVKECEPHLSRRDAWFTNPKAALAAAAGVGLVLTHFWWTHMHKYKLHPVKLKCRWVQKHVHNVIWQSAKFTSFPSALCNYWQVKVSASQFLWN